MTTSRTRRPGPGRPTREAIYQRFAAAIAELDNYGGLPKPPEAKRLWDDVWHREAHHSTAIEGNTLILREVEQLLQEGRAVGSKALKDYMEVLGYADAARWVYQQAVAPEEWQHDELITISEVRQVHALALGKVWEVAPHPDAHPAEAPGNFRRHEIRPFAGGMTPPSHPLVAAELSAWVDDANRLKTDIDTGFIGIEDVPEGPRRGPRVRVTTRPRRPRGMPPPPQPDPYEARLATCDHPQGTTRPLPPSPPTCRPGRPPTPGRTDRAFGDRQPPQVDPQHRGAGQVRATRGARR